MDNYEINILRRGGNWKKIQADDLIMDEINYEISENDKSKNKTSNNDFYSYIEKVNEIIVKLENLEDQKNILKEELKTYESEFLKKKKITEDKINKFSKEKEFIDKTINVIKNLKSF
tara:strand:- start:1011 stop:1361 length:351 start_codon:yes stop_codon:yes gene_type:complete